jgi:hypothetical protein
VTVTTDLELEVLIAALHAAVRAVLPHAERPKLGADPGDQPLARVRIVAAASELHLMATNGRTSALAAVGIIEGSDSRGIRFSPDDGPYVADIHPKSLRLIRDGLTPEKTDGEMSGVARLAFTGPADDHDGKLTAIDSTGLWPGSEVTRKLLPLSEQFPDVAGALSKALGAAEGTYKPLVADGPDLTLFTAASKAYDAALQVEPVGSADQRGWIVLCGPAFAGTIAGGHHDDDSMKRRDRWRRTHMERLGLATTLASVG